MFRPEELRRFTVAEYRRMIDLGILTEEDRIELLEGFLVFTFRQTPQHSSSKDRLLSHFHEHRLPAGWVALGPTAVTLSTSETEPELAIARGCLRDYATAFARPHQVAIVVEVADASLERDRFDKGRIYARDSIPVYWVVNLVDRQIEVYTDPTGPVPAPVYRNRKDYPPGTSVPVVLDGATVGSIAVDDVLP